MDGDRQEARLAELIRESRRTVALTGAGISVPSGIPDFRSPQSGLWQNVNPMEVAHIDALRSNPQRFWEFYRPRFHLLADKQPNPAHLALVELERQGRLEAVITQNIDRLHAVAGSRRLLEIHGSVRTSSCTACAAVVELERVEELFAEDGVPYCETCAAPLRPDVVLFGEMLPESEMLEAQQLALESELILVIGSSLEVHPAAGLVDQTLVAGGKLAILTMGDTPYDDEAEVRLSGDVGEILPRVVAAAETQAAKGAS